MDVFWLLNVCSTERVSAVELNAAVCGRDEAMAQLDFRDAFDYVIKRLPPEFHRIGVWR